MLEFVYCLTGTHFVSTNTQIKTEDRRIEISLFLLGKMISLFPLFISFSLENVGKIENLSLSLSLRYR